MKKVILGLLVVLPLVVSAKAKTTNFSLICKEDRLSSYRHFPMSEYDGGRNYCEMYMEYENGEYKIKFGCAANVQTERDKKELIDKIEKHEISLKIARLYVDIYTETMYEIFESGKCKVIDKDLNDITPKREASEASDN